MTISPAWADGGASRDGNAGGVNQASGPGGGGLPTTGGSSGGGGGGGAGETGGAGGTGSGTGSAGGATPGANGGGGGSANVAGGGGGGGGGGAHGEVISTPGTTLAPATGGAGGSGGDTRLGSPAPGGGGGAGGWGASIIAGGSFTNTGSISGGNGGSGGRGSNGGATVGSGAGGSGGLGVGFAVSGATLTNSGTISGGIGGAGGAGEVQISFGGVGGDGGAGLSGSGLTISNNGDIIGGKGGTSSLLGRAGNGGAGITGSDLTISNTSGIVGGNGGAANRSSAGDGGVGITASGLMIFNSGSVTGGNGGAANVNSLGGGNAGAGNAAIVGSGLTITNSGTIIGGNGGAITVLRAENGNAGAGGAGITGSGLTIINSGSIIGGRGGTANLGSAGAGSVGITGSGLTIINNGDIAGGTSGDGLTQASPITFTGGTNVLELQAQSAIAGNVVAFSAADTFRLGGTAAASFDVGQIGAKYQNFGVFEKTGTSTWTLTNTTAAATAWTVTGGLLSFSSAGAFGTGQITLNGGGLQWATGNTIDISSRLAAIGGGGATFDTNGNDVTFATALTGVGGLTKTGSGTLTLDAINSYGGSTTVNGGMLQFGVGNAFASGSALAVNAGGTFNLNGFNQAVGALSGNGTVRLGSGTLTVGSDNSSTSFAGVIAESGNLTKTGSGTLTLTGINTLTGTTAVNGGTLVLNGSVGGDATIAAGATLMGTGTVGGNATITGNIAPGNSIGTLTVGGNYTQTGTYTVEVNGAGQSDLINITGTATLTGGTVSVQAAAGTFARNTTYTILTAAGGLGGTTYAGVTSNFAFLEPSLSYTANAVLLSLFSSANSFQNGAQTPNQRAVGAALDQASPTASGDFNTVLNALYGLSTTQGPRTLDAIGGQAYSGFASLQVQSALLFMDSFQFQAGGGVGAGGSASVPGKTYLALKADDCGNACDVEPLWGAWGGGMGAVGTVAGDNNGHGLTYNLGGFIAGLDRHFVPSFRAGIAAGFNAASLYAQGMPGTGTSNTLQFALYGEYQQDAFYLDALAGYGHSDNRMTRPIVIPGLPFRSAQGYTTANTFFGQLEAGYKVTVAPSFGGFVTPFARLQASTSTQAGFNETGADSLNLTIAQQTTNSLRTVFGTQLGAAIDAPWREKLNLNLRLGWSHEFADLTRPVMASFAGAPAIGFTTFGAEAPRDGVVLGLGANTAIAERTTAYLRYDGDLSGGNTNHMLSAGIRCVW